MKERTGDNRAPQAHPAQPETPLVLHTEFAAAFDSAERGSAFLEIDRATGEARNLPASEVDLRRERYRLQREAGSILGPRHRINYCHMAIGHQKENAEVRQHGERYSLGGLAVCGNVWACPVCSSRVAERRADEIRQAMAWAKKRGLHVHLVTLTTRHNAMQSAAELVASISEAWRYVTSHRRYKRPGGPRSRPGLRSFYGFSGYIKALEVTHGGHGWHPHFHLVMFTRKKMGESARAELSALWRDAIQAQGYEPPSDAHGVDIQDGSKAGEYINKYGDDGELLQRKTGKKKGQPVSWDAADELTKANIKKGRGQNRKPFQLLQDAADGCEESARLYREYVAAFKGRSQLQWSPGLRSAVGLDDVSDEELAEQAGDSCLVLAIPRRLWQPFAAAVRRRTGGASRGGLLKLAERGGLDAVARYLAGFARISPGQARQLIERATAAEQLPDLAA
jgi:hypothetical protein|tara:strand:+ start:717 stop:2072 length:1356 start_codon:yes stop_codon:yes gene_type:complete